jgi:hypothetical protein
LLGLLHAPDALFPNPKTCHPDAAEGRRRISTQSPIAIPANLASHKSKILMFTLDQYRSCAIVPNVQVKHLIPGPPANPTVSIACASLKTTSSNAFKINDMRTLWKTRDVYPPSSHFGAARASFRLRPRKQIRYCFLCLPPAATRGLRIQSNLRELPASRASGTWVVRFFK